MHDDGASVSLDEGLTRFGRPERVTRPWIRLQQTESLQQDAGPDYDQHHAAQELGGPAEPNPDPVPDPNRGERGHQRYQADAEDRQEDGDLQHREGHPDGRRVRLKGYIDRLDEVDRSLRIAGQLGQRRDSSALALYGRPP